MIKILLDNGHGFSTPGKRSPDGKLREYAYAREITKRIKTDLDKLGIESIILVPEDDDISLSERCKRANNIYDEDSKNCILISVHLNAAGNGSQWMTGRGWEAYTYHGETKSDELATYLYESAKKCLPPGTKLRTDYSDGDPDKEAGFYILKHTKMPAVLTENLFQDNKEDVDFLLSEEGKEAITNLHVQGILKYITKNCKGK